MGYSTPKVNRKKPDKNLKKSKGFDIFQPRPGSTQESFEDKNSTVSLDTKVESYLQQSISREATEASEKGTRKCSFLLSTNPEENSPQAFSKASLRSLQNENSEHSLLVVGVNSYESPMENGSIPRSVDENENPQQFNSMERDSMIQRRSAGCQYLPIEEERYESNYSMFRPDNMMEVSRHSIDEIPDENDNLEDHGLRENSRASNLNYLSRETLLRIEDYLYQSKLSEGKKKKSSSVLKKRTAPRKILRNPSSNYCTTSPRKGHRSSILRFFAVDDVRTFVPPPSDSLEPMADDRYSMPRHRTQKMYSAYGAPVHSVTNQSSRTIERRKATCVSNVAEGQSETTGRIKISKSFGKGSKR